MKKNVKVRYLGITAYRAMCSECGFAEEDNQNREQTRNSIYRHIRQTGHTVLVEKTVATHYKPESEKL